MSSGRRLIDPQPNAERITWGKDFSDDSDPGPDSKGGPASYRIPSRPRARPTPTASAVAGENRSTTTSEPSSARSRQASTIDASALDRLAKELPAKTEKLLAMLKEYTKTIKQLDGLVNPTNYDAQTTPAANNDLVSTPPTTPGLIDVKGRITSVHTTTGKRAALQDSVSTPVPKRQRKSSEQEMGQTEAIGTSGEGSEIEDE